MARIVIIGGGIAGLSAAYDLHRSGENQVTLLESSDRLGGKIVTTYLDGMTIEGGPDSVFTSKPWAVELMTELGLESEFSDPIGSGFSILVGGKLHVVPRALASLIPTANSALESLAFVSSASRKRIMSEHSVPKGTGDDETIASFFRRRFGTRFSKTIAEPLLAGIHAGHAETLSMKALYPTYIGLEQKHGSLTGDRPSAPTGATSHPPRKVGFLTLKRGLQQLVDALSLKLEGATIHLNYQATGIVENGDGFTVMGSHPVKADAIILALPSYAAADLIAGISPEAVELLRSIRHASTAVATFEFDLHGFAKDLHGNGFLVPADEPSGITGCTFTSLKWADRCQSDRILIRCFMGADRGLNIDPLSDQQLLDLALETISKQLRPKVAPIYSQIDRWARAMPQYEVGHLELMDRLDSALTTPKIVLTGCSYRGTGIPDCIRQGREAAVKVTQALSAPSN